MAILDIKQCHQTQSWKRTIQEVTSDVWSILTQWFLRRSKCKKLTDDGPQLTREAHMIEPHICYRRIDAHKKMTLRMKTIELPNLQYMALMVWFMVFNATFNNISVISWQPVLLVEETRLPWENYRPVKLYHIYRVHLAWVGFELTT